MVESSIQSDGIFGALSDSTRRAILILVVEVEQSISEISKNFGLTFGAISKHILVLEKANLIIKRRVGKESLIIANQRTLKIAKKNIEKYEIVMQIRFDKLEKVLNKEN